MNEKTKRHSLSLTLPSFTGTSNRPQTRKAYIFNSTVFIRIQYSITAAKKQHQTAPNFQNEREGSRMWEKKTVPYWLNDEQWRYGKSAFVLQIKMTAVVYCMHRACEHLNMKFKFERGEKFDWKNLHSWIYEYDREAQKHQIQTQKNCCLQCVGNTFSWVFVFKCKVGFLRRTGLRINE